MISNQFKLQHSSHLLKNEISCYSCNEGMVSPYKTRPRKPLFLPEKGFLVLIAWSCGYSARISSMSRLVSEKKVEEKDQKICSSSSAWPCMAPSSASADRSEPRGTRLRSSLFRSRLVLFGRRLRFSKKIFSLSTLLPAIFIRFSPHLSCRIQPKKEPGPF